MIAGGGFKLWTDDPVVVAVIRRCAELEAKLTEMRHAETARFRTLRRDVDQIKRSVRKIADHEG
jgi:hypothetical protein